MDQDLKKYLDDMRRDLTTQIMDSRHHAEELTAGVRAHAERLNAESLGRDRCRRHRHLILPSVR